MQTNGRQTQRLPNPPGYVWGPGPTSGNASNRTFVVAVVLGVLFLVAAAVGVWSQTSLSSTRSDLNEARASLNETQAALQQEKTAHEDTATTLESTESSLSAANSQITDLEDDLEASDAALTSVSRCSMRLLNAWYGTINYSYTVTGYALEDAVYSPACRVTRTAYSSVGGGSF